MCVRVCRSRSFGVGGVAGIQTLCLYLCLSLSLCLSLCLSLSLSVSLCLSLSVCLSVCLLFLLFGFDCLHPHHLFVVVF